MNKEQIQQRFDEILKGLGWTFYPDEENLLKHFYRNKGDLLDLMESCFNLGLDVAADNAEADYNILDYNEKPRGSNVECYVLKESIFKLKL